MGAEPMKKYNMPFDMWKWEFQDWHTITEEDLRKLIGNPLGLTQVEYDEIVNGKVDNDDD